MDNDNAACSGPVQDLFLERYPAVIIQNAGMQECRNAGMQECKNAGLEKVLYLISSLLVRT